MKTQITNFQLLANYNKWANEKIITSCKKLTETEYMKDRGAFFSSIHGTLNHLLVVDRAFVAYIEEKNHGLKSLDQILYENLFQLEEARIKEDKRLVDLINNLSEESIYKEITYNGFETGKNTHTINTILITCSTIKHIIVVKYTTCYHKQALNHLKLIFQISLRNEKT